MLFVFVFLSKIFAKISVFPKTPLFVKHLELLKAHTTLDKAVDKRYELSGKIDDKKQVAKIFELHKSLNLDFEFDKVKRKKQIVKQIPVKPTPKPIQSIMDF